MPNPADYHTASEFSSGKAPTEAKPPDPIQIPETSNINLNQTSETSENVAPENSGISPESNTPIEDSHVIANKDKINPDKFKLSASTKIILIFVVVVGLIAFIGLSVALAYDQIKPLNGTKFQLAVSNFVQSLSFTPKTPKFLVMKAYEANQKVNSASFDLSTSITNSSKNSSLDVLGLNSIDIEAKGDADSKDPNNPLINMNLSITKDFNADLREKDKIVYFKINKIPTSLLTLMGIDTTKTDPLLNKWISENTSSLNTEAKQLLEKKASESAKADSQTTLDNLQKDLQTYLNDTILNHITQKVEMQDGFPVYVLTLDANNEVLDYIQSKLPQTSNPSNFQALTPQSLQNSKISSYLKNAKITISIDKEKYHVRRTEVSFDIYANPVTIGSLINPNVLGYSTLTDSQQKFSFALVVKASDFGKKVVVDVPENPIPFEQFAKSLSAVFAPSLGMPQTGTQNQVPGTLSPKPSSLNFHSEGTKDIGNGVNLYISYVSEDQNTITINAVFTNTSSTNQNVNSSFIMMQNKTVATLPNTANSTSMITPNSIKSYVLTYKKLQPTPYTWVYLNPGTSNTTELGTYSL